MWALLAGRSTTFGPWLAGLVGVCASSLVACSFSWSAPGAAVVGETSFSSPGSEAGLELDCSCLAPGFTWLSPGLVELSACSTCAGFSPLSLVVRTLDRVLSVPLFQHQL